MRIHTFDNTTDAYNATQTLESISDGDVLVVPPENVVGFLLEAWPVAVTLECGEFHRFDPNASDALIDLKDKYAASIADALDVARVVGALIEGRKPRATEGVVAEDNVTPDRCTCQWADDAGDPEVGPDPYIVEFDNECPRHGVEEMGW